MKPSKDHLVATYSIVGYDPEKKEWGVAVQSKFIAVGAYVPFAKANVGAIATQAWCNTSYGPRGLEMLEQGMDAQSVLDALIGSDEHRNLRQVGIIDGQGNTATYTGSECFDWAGGFAGKNCVSQGNILMNKETVTEMNRTFEETKGELAHRLIQALEGAQSAGGDSRGKQSAAVFVVREKGGYGGYNDHVVNLRVDDHPEPIKELGRLYKLQKLYFGQTKPGNLIEMDAEILAEVKSRLRRLGYLVEESHQGLDQVFVEAMKRYYLCENFDDRCREDAFIDLEVLDFMREQSDVRGEGHGK